MSIINSIKTYAIQIGQSVTDTQNFQLSANNDGTGKLARKSDGTGGDIISWDASGKVTLTTAPAIVAVQSMIRCDSSNGYGSSSTCIRRFLNNTVTQGSDITYADSATLGAAFTINVSGVYAITFTDSMTPGTTVSGISKNTTQPATAIQSITLADIVAISSTVSSTVNLNCLGAIQYFASGSVIRPHTNGGAIGAAPIIFTIVRVS